MKPRLRHALLFLVSAIPLMAQKHDTYNGYDIAANQVLVRVTSNDQAILQQLRQAGNADDFRPLNRALGLYVMHSPSASVTALLATLKAASGVTYVEPDYYVKLVNSPNDTYFAQQWSMLNTSKPGADIGATYAWNVSTGSSANVVGVVDTGVDYTHPDLAANIWAAPSAFTVNLSWGQLTCPAGSHGYNSIAKSCVPMDDNQHGTHVSGTIGALGNNAAGVAGVNWTTRIMGLKFMDSSGNGLTSDAIDAIEFAIQAKTIFGSGANVRVLSNSWGGSGYSKALLDEINKAGSNEMLFVAAAGNDTQNIDSTPTYPASYTAANVISVAATTSTDTLASFSNWGATSVDLGAPGVNIVSTLPGSSYGYMSGTSMATPHVSGAAMLVLAACNLNTVALKAALMSNVDPIPALAGITVTGGRLNVNKAIRSCASIPSGPSGTVTFLKTDTTTAGSWYGAYGADGAIVTGDTSSYPSYVTPAPTGNSSYTWAATTSDTRALQKISSPTSRVSACWFSATSFTIDLKFSDTNTHQLALYLLDWDGYGGGRNERIDLLDTNTGAILDTRSVSNFSGGEYLVWNLSGHVILRVTNNNSNSNGLITGLFFGGASNPVGPAAPGTATFLKTDTSTSGSWRGVYGGEGGNVIGDTASYPSYVAVNPASNLTYVWNSSTSDARAPQKLSSPTSRIAACWYSSGTFTMDVAFNDSNTHQVAFYLLDWDNYAGGRAERVDILDTSNNVLDTRTVSSFQNGIYLVWNLSGHVIVRVTNNNPSSNAVVNAVLFGAGGVSTSTAIFLKSDTSTQGTWKGVYGADGANVIDDAAVTPSYVTLTPAANSTWLWTTTSTDVRALQKESSTSGRIAACWYSYSPFTATLSFTDANVHQVALYFLDWDGDGGGRSQRIDVMDAGGNVLDTRSISGFQNGVYLVWNFSGKVTFRLTSTNPASNALVNGIFFR